MTLMIHPVKTPGFLGAVKQLPVQQRFGTTSEEPSQSRTSNKRPSKLGWAFLGVAAFASFVTWLVTAEVWKHHTMQWWQDGLDYGHFLGSRQTYDFARFKSHLYDYQPRKLVVFKPKPSDSNKTDKLGVVFRVMDPRREDKALMISFIAYPKTEKARQLLLDAHGLEQGYNDWEPSQRFELPPKQPSTGNALFDEMSNLTSALLHGSKFDFDHAIIEYQLEQELLEAFSTGKTEATPWYDEGGSFLDMLRAHGIGVEQLKITRSEVGYPIMFKNPLKFKNPLNG